MRRYAESRPGWMPTDKSDNHGSAGHSGKVKKLIYTTRGGILTMSPLYYLL